jgi:hypothetical protein
MCKERSWNQEDYEASATFRAWHFTAFENRWDNCQQSGPDMAVWQEIKTIFLEERAFGTVPEWALQILDRMLSAPLPPCGHYCFPDPILQVCGAIGKETCPKFVIGCYSADAERKTLMSYYVFCVDAWEQDCILEVAQAEMAIRPDLGKDWNQILANVYNALGNPTPQKKLLARRLIHRLRWWIKSLIWKDDHRNRFLLDAYLGDVRGKGDWGKYGDSGFSDPFFTELKVPCVIEMEQQIVKNVPDGETLVRLLRENHLCGPKTFRNVERAIALIGALGSEKKPDYGASILDCENTCPDIRSYKEWYTDFMKAIGAWLNGDATAIPLLGDSTPVKRWLARILWLRLRLYEQYDNLGKLVGTQPSGKCGTRRLVSHFEEL